MKWGETAMDDCVFPKCLDNLKMVYEGCYAGFYECDYCENIVSEEEVEYSRKESKYVDSI